MKALTPAQKKTRQSAVGFFLNVAAAYVMVFLVGINDVGDWFALIGCVICIIGSAYYVQHDIKESMREDSDAS